MRRIATSNEFFDILDNIGNGKFITIGYVTGANLNVPTVSRKNPLTNRMKKYADYSIFRSDSDGEIGALVKISSYNMRYLNRTTVGKKYGEYKDAANAIRGNFGIDPIANKESYKQGTDWSPNGPELYKGQNTELQSHSYNPQNIFGVKPKSVVYAVDTEGHIIKELSQEQIRPYLKTKREVDGVAALRKMGAEEEKIQDYIAQIENLKFKYQNFESNSILWIAATINGEKIVYINDNLARAVDGINIRPEDFRAIAMERYQVDLANLHEMTMKNLNVLSEMDWRTYASAKEKAERLSNSQNYSEFEKKRRKNQANALRKHSIDMCDKQYGVDKIKQKQRDAEINGKPYEHSNGDLKRLDRQSNDVHDYYSGKQEYKNGKWLNKENKEIKNNKVFLRLTENELKGMISESVNKILSELDWRTYASAAKKNDEWREANPNHRANKWNRSYDFRRAAKDTFDKEHGLEGQYDGERYGGEKGTINYNIFAGDDDVTGSRVHDFGDGDSHGLGHNVYHMGKKYGKDGGYGRTRMWDYAHETTPEEFYGDEEMGRKFRQAEKDVDDFNSGKTHYVKGNGWTNENRKINEAFKNNQGYSHFAVSKKSGKIVNGWDYSDYDPSELREFKKDYFDVDLADYGFNPKNFRILTYKYLVRNGINPDDNANWANNDEANAEFVG